MDMTRDQPGRPDQGGAFSLWVVMMVPVAALAAVAAMAGPQRLAAESAMGEAADDLAALAVVWRDGQSLPGGPLRAFPPDCAAPTDEQSEALDELEAGIGALDDSLDTSDPGFAAQFEPLHEQLEALRMQLLPASDPSSDPPPFDKAGLQANLDELISYLEWDIACEFVFEAVARDLGQRGVDVRTLRGFYSDGLSSSPQWWRCNVDPTLVDADECEAAGGAWDAPAIPCASSHQTVVPDAVHVAIAADWQDAGWAAAQLWPGGRRVAAESIGRLTQHDPTGAPSPRCADLLAVLDTQGRPVWADPSAEAPNSRTLSQLVPRTAFSE